MSQVHPSNRIGVMRLFTALSLLSMALLACQSAPPAAPFTPTPLSVEQHTQLEQKVTVQIVQPSATVIPTQTPIPTATPVPIRSVYIDPNLPTDIQVTLKTQVQLLAAQIPDTVAKLQLTTGETADIVISAAPPARGQATLPLIQVALAVVAPFPTVADTITLASLAGYWRGDTDALKYITNDQSTPQLFVDERTLAMLNQLLGERASTTPVQIVRDADLIDAAWTARPSSFAIIPFDRLEVRWKQLWLDGMNLFDKELDESQYPLTYVVRANLGAAGDAQLLSEFPATTNRDVSKMATVAMTGVTAMVRGTAVMMERKGITYPAQMIRDWLVTADVTHISNEVSFWDKCPAPTFNDGVSMCSNPRYIELLEYVGTDIIELSGNHLWDKGVQHLNTTIDIYDELGWKYFAGGRDYDDSQRPVTMTLAGNKIAFVGCNYFGANWATPTNNLPGSALCGSDDPRQLDLIIASIQSLTQDGYLVIATLQYAEFYFYEPTLQQARDFKALRDAGAVIVNGSQGHHAQGFDVSEQGFIHYGTGNLFFGDQAAVGAHQTFVDRHTFYDGRYLGVDLRTAYIEDYSQPVPMSAADRAKFLRVLFAATGY